jgi:hypothetical protein
VVQRVICGIAKGEIRYWLVVPWWCSEALVLHVHGVVVESTNAGGSRERPERPLEKHMHVQPPTTLP